MNAVKQRNSLFPSPCEFRRHPTLDRLADVLCAGQSEGSDDNDGSRILVIEPIYDVIGLVAPLYLRNERR